MSENSWQNGYGEYFESLEKQLNKERNTKAVTEKKPDLSKGRKKAINFKGFYKVIRIRKSVLAMALAVVITVATVLIVTLSSGGEEKTPTVSADKVTQQSVPKIPKRISYKETIKTVDVPLSNDAKTAIVVDKSSNTIVAQRNAHRRAYPASTTKIMTLLVAVENNKNLKDIFTMSYDITDPLYVADASLAGFLNNEKITVNDLIYGTILPSGAEAAMGLAVKTAGTEEEFVKLMNKKVKELGLKNTNFTNVTGLHNEKNYSSAYDMAIILDAAMQNDFCREVLSTFQYTTTKTEQHPEGILLSSTLFSNMYGTEPETATILGGKTGYLNESGYCIASFGKCNQNNNEYIVVTLGNSSRWPAVFGQIDLYKEFAE